jgi:hypothetical protein
MLRLLIATLLSWLAVTNAAADYGFIVKCTGQKARIVPYESDKEVRSPAMQECRLPGGRTIRAKLGLGPTYPYGEGGAIPAKWLSVWIDKAKVVSRFRFVCDYDGRCLTRIVVTPSGMNVCSPIDPPEDGGDSSQLKVKERCDFTPNDLLPTARDHLEYPLQGERVPPAPGTFMRLVSKHRPFCGQFIESDSALGVTLPHSAKRIEPHSTSGYEFAGYYGHYEFDINNDGKLDKVVGLHASNHYRDGDQYFVFVGGEPGVAPDPALHSDDRYAAEATSIVPTRWMQNSAVSETLSAAPPWWDPDDHPTFEPRYLHLIPFIDHGSTYFIGASEQSDAQHWRFIFRPRHDYSLDEECAFQRVRVRY